MMTWQDYITVDPSVCHGKACIKEYGVGVADGGINLTNGRDLHT